MIDFNERDVETISAPVYFKRVCLIECNNERVMCTMKDVSHNFLVFFGEKHSLTEYDRDPYIGFWDHGRQIVRVE